MSTKVVLYYSDNCKYCKQFEPTWEALKSTFESNNISYEQHEAKEKELMQSKSISGFPTIRIETRDGEYEYAGPRNPEEIISHVMTVSKNGNMEEIEAPLSENSLSPNTPAAPTLDGLITGQQGGAVEDAQWESKYKKYKAKYLQLKSFMEKNNLL